MASAHFSSSAFFYFAPIDWSWRDVYLAISKLLEELHDLLGVSVGKGLIFLHKVLADRGNAFLIQLVEALIVFLLILPIGPVRAEFCGLFRPFGPFSV